MNAIGAFFQSFRTDAKAEPAAETTREETSSGSTAPAEHIPTPLKMLRAILHDQPRLAGLLPYSAYLPDDKIFINDDGIGFCLEVRPQTGATEETVRILTSLLVDCPTGTGVQFILYASPNIISSDKSYASTRLKDDDHEQFAHERGRPARNQNMYRQIVRERIEFIRQGLKDSIFETMPYLFRNYRCIISVVIPGTGDGPEKERLIRMRDIFRSTLAAAMFPAMDWTVTDLIKFCTEVLNPQQTPNDFAPQYDDGRLIKQQIVNADTVCRVGPEGLMFSDPRGQRAELRCYSVKNYPEVMTLWEMGDLTGDQLQNSLQYPCPFLIVMGVSILDYEKTKSVTQMKSARATTNSTSQMAKFLPDIQKRKADWDIAMQALSNGQSMVSVYHQVLLFAKPENAAAAEHAAVSIWRSKNFDLTNDMYMQPQALLSCLPMMLSKPFFEDLKKAGRVSTKTSWNAINLAPLLAEWAGTKTPTVRLFGRRGQEAYLDFFDNTAGNYNVAVAAASGAGKSVFMQEVALSYLGCGAKVWTIDVGRSYERLAKLLGGQFVEFTVDSDICLNPFSMIQNLDEEMDVIKPILAQMAMPNGRCNDLQLAVFEEAIRMVWDSRGPDMTVTDISAQLLQNARRGEGRQVLESAAERVSTGGDGLSEQLAMLVQELRAGANNADQRILDLAKLLYPFTKQGVYGKYFDGKANVKFESDYVVLELEELNVKKDLQSVVLLTLLFAIQREMFFDRSRKKLLMIDEAWDLMGGGSTAEFMEKVARRVRKYRGSLLTATQSLQDYYENDAAAAIIANSDWMCLLRQKPEAVEQVVASGKLSLGDTLKRLLMSVRTEHGVYSEVYIRHPGGTAVERLILDPFSQLLFTTKAEEYTEIKRRTEAGMNIGDAIKDVIRTKQEAARSHAN